ncbi:F0F1 ATP synthase subunit gamma [Candidatus Daviesbacteria bacterium]|nr:F0F1 ATP synthase subunit gamma [Candidatus Daviesbacteria bacterium]
MTIKQINELIDTGEALKDIAGSFSEIASVRLKRLRKQVEGTRTFFNEVAKLYGLVKLVAIRKQTIQQPKINTVSLLLTSNLRFYGHINSQIIHFFINQTNLIKTDRIIIGKLAKQTLQAVRYPNPYKQVIFKKDLPSTHELKKLVETVKNYTQILVFYSQFKNVLEQTAVAEDITQAQTTALNKQPEIKELAFIFEPEVNRMMQFFDTQIKTALLQQTFLEAELARVASRLIAMDEAESRAGDYLEKQQFLLSQAKRALENKRFLETWSITKYEHS